MISVGERGVGLKDTGTGPTVLFLHGSMSSSAAWRPIAKELPDGLRTVMLDLWGYGDSDAWNGDWPIDFTAEAELVEAVVEHIGAPVHLVGHSHGGTLALAVANRGIADLQSMVLLEATPFELLHRCGDAELYAELRSTFENYFSALERGEPFAVSRVVDYWDGKGSFQKMPEKVRQFLSAATPMNVTNIKCAFNFDPGLDAFRKIECRTLAVFGNRTAPSSAAMTRHIAELLPNAAVQELDGAGHFLINTHAEQIATWLDRWVRQGS